MTRIKYNRSIAFTLAEVLITIGIIGVVAAITIPNLIANYQKHQTVQQLKKTYADLQNIIRLSVVENGEASGWEYPISENNIQGCKSFVETYFIPFVKGGNFKIQKELYKMKNLNGNESIAPTCGFEMIDGRIISFYPNTPNNYIWLFADINGMQGPNRIGQDIFVFNAQNFRNSEYRIRAWNETNELNELYTGSYACSKTNENGRYVGWNCTAVIVKNNWKISKDYPW
ncbi:type II secretion system protein [bacterium]|nr:type II secretion system protein [bacterium]